MRQLIIGLMVLAGLTSGAGVANASDIYDDHAILRGVAGGNNIGTCHITSTGGGKALLRVSVKSNLINPMQIFDADGYLLDFTTSAMSTETFVQWISPYRLNLSKIHVVTQPNVPVRSTDEKFWEAVARTMDQGRLLGTCTFEPELE